MPQPLRLPPRLAEGKQLLQASSILERGELGFFPSIFCMASLPTRARPGQTEYKRTFHTPNGAASFTVTAPSEYGLPYGAYLRAIALYIQSTLIKQHNQQDRNPREIYLGKNLSDSMTRITGLDHSRTLSGGSRSSRLLFERQLDAFTHSAMYFRYPGDRVRRERLYTVTEEIEQPANPELFPHEPGVTPIRSEPEWETHLLISQPFYTDSVSHGVPVDEGILRALWPSPLRMDVYVWLTFRANHLQGAPLTLSWRSLHEQLGSEYAPGSHRRFRAAFRDALRSVQQVYDVDDPQCIRFTEAGDKVTLLIKRSSVPRRYTVPAPQLAAPEAANIVTVDATRPLPVDQPLLLDLAAAAETEAAATCPHCQGRKQILTRDKFTNYVACPDCGGTGKVRPRPPDIPA